MTEIAHQTFETVDDNRIPDDTLVDAAGQRFESWLTMIVMDNQGFRQLNVTIDEDTSFAIDPSADRDTIEEITDWVASQDYDEVDVVVSS